MRDSFDKLTTARCEREAHGLMWVETVDWDEDTGLEWSVWLLIDYATDRMLVSIDGPSKLQFLYGADTEDGRRRKFLSLDGAKRWALREAVRMMQMERMMNAAAERKMRRMERCRR